MTGYYKFMDTKGTHFLSVHDDDANTRQRMYVLNPFIVKGKCQFFLFQLSKDQFDFRFTSIGKTYSNSCVSTL